MTDNIKQDIEKLLHTDAECTAEEYSERRKTASDAADFGVKETNDVPTNQVSEDEKHRRIQSNYYGSQINFDVAMLDKLNLIVSSLDVIIDKLDKKE